MLFLVVQVRENGGIKYNSRKLTCFDRWDGGKTLGKWKKFSIILRFGARANWRNDTT